jgi:hypothetical protein
MDLRVSRDRALYSRGRNAQESKIRQDAAEPLALVGNPVPFRSRRCDVQPPRLRQKRHQLVGQALHRETDCGSASDVGERPPRWRRMMRASRRRPPAATRSPPSRRQGLRRTRHHLRRRWRWRPLWRRRHLRCRQRTAGPVSRLPDGVAQLATPSLRQPPPPPPPLSREASGIGAVGTWRSARLSCGHEVTTPHGMRQQRASPRLPGVISHRFVVPGSSEREERRWQTVENLCCPVCRRAVRDQRPGYWAADPQAPSAQAPAPGGGTGGW